MQNVHVKRYKQGPVAGFSGTIEAEDRSWVVFIDDKGEPSLWRRVEIIDDDGKVDHAYADVEQVAEVTSGLPEANGPQPAALDYSVRQIDGAFEASLSHRNIIATGDTEHEAVARLLNWVAQLCAAGSLDHTGRPAVGNARRYGLVFPSDH